MRLLVVSAYPDRVEKNSRFWEDYDWSVHWTSGMDIKHDFWSLAVRAAREGWDHDLIIVQDDIQLLSVPQPDGDISVYSGQSGPTHVCPRAFSCSPEGWQRVEYKWRPTHQAVLLSEPGVTVQSSPTHLRLCEAWTPVDTIVSIAVHHDS